MSRGAELSNPLTDNVVSGSGVPPRNEGRNEGRNAGKNTLSEEVVIGLLGVHRYRLVTADQFAHLAGLSLNYTREKLRTLERQKLLGSIGNAGLRGGAKAPKLYYLTRKGYDELCAATRSSSEELGAFVKPHTSTAWSPVMAHRVGTIDLLVAAEVALRDMPSYQVIATLHEYRRQRNKRTSVPETADQLSDHDTRRLVPDAVLVVENTASKKRGLYFIEYDRGTERLTSPEVAAYSIIDKFNAYETYLRSGRFARTYRPFGYFRQATILFVTTTPERRDNLRRTSCVQHSELHDYFKLSTHADAKAAFFGSHWYSRNPSHPSPTPLLKGTAS